MSLFSAASLSTKTSFGISSKETMLLLLLLFSPPDVVVVPAATTFVVVFVAPTESFSDSGSSCTGIDCFSISRSFCFCASSFKSLCFSPIRATVKFNSLLYCAVKESENISSQTSAEMANVSQPMLPKFAKSTADRTFFTKIFDSEPHLVIVFIISSVALKPSRPASYIFPNVGAT